MTRLKHHRSAFTLIELLVTMGLIVTLLAIAVAVSNSATADSYKIVGSADKVTQAMLQAKARAQRDRAPRGVRLVADANYHVREVIFIEAAEPWLPDQSFTHRNNGSGSGTVNEANRSMFVIRYPQNPAASSTNFVKPEPTQCRAFLLLSPADKTRFDNEVFVGDIVYSPDLGAAAMVRSKTTAGTLQWVPTGFSVLDLGLPTMTNPDMGAGYTPSGGTQNRATFQTTAFGIHRGGRPLAGEPSLILGRNVVVDLTASQGVTQPNPLPMTIPAINNYDILFAPNGQVMNFSEGLLALTVRDSFKLTVPLTANNWLTVTPTNAANYKAAGEMILIAIYPKTGAVSTRSVVEPDGSATYDPYKFARDAINSGL